MNIFLILSRLAIGTMSMIGVTAESNRIRCILLLELKEQRLDSHLYVFTTCVSSVMSQWSEKSHLLVRITIMDYRTQLAAKDEQQQPLVWRGLLSRNRTKNTFYLPTHKELKDTSPSSYIGHGTSCLRLGHRRLGEISKVKFNRFPYIIDGQLSIRNQERKPNSMQKKFRAAQSCERWQLHC